MTTECIRAALQRARRLITSTRGAFDMMSVLTGAVMVVILVGGTLAATIGVIPWVQDNGARQDLSAVSTAQGVAKTRDGRFLDRTGLAGASYLTTPDPSLAVGTNPDGSCWVGFSRSQAGTTFYSTSTTGTPQPFAKTIDTGCLPTTNQLTLAKSVGMLFPALVSGWGFGGYGALQGAASHSVPFDLATGPLADKTVTAVAAGQQHACALADNAIYCWGQNPYGAGGNGTTDNSLTPVAVDMTGALAGKTITAITAGVQYTCAIADGAAYCWGHNSNGQLGTGNLTGQLRPVAVTSSGALAGKTVTAISAANGFTCAIADGAAYCWGYGYSGQLGNGVAGNTSTPVAVNVSGVLAGKTVTAISGQSAHTCAVASGAAYCWGVNSYGKLGNGTTTDSQVPVAVISTGALAGKTVTNAAVSDDGSCAVADGAVYCWGAGANGQLGVGTPPFSSTQPLAVDSTGVLAGKQVTSLDMGERLVCVVASGAAYCWGKNSAGQVGNGTTTDALRPVAVNTGSSLAGQKVTQVSVFYQSTLVAHE